MINRIMVSFVAAICDSIPKSQWCPKARVVFFDGDNSEASIFKQERLTLPLYSSMATPVEETAGTTFF